MTQTERRDYLIASLKTKIEAIGEEAWLKASLYKLENDPYDPQANAAKFIDYAMAPDYNIPEGW